METPRVDDEEKQNEHQAKLSLETAQLVLKTTMNDYLWYYPLYKKFNKENQILIQQECLLKIIIKSDNMLKL